MTQPGYELDRDRTGLTKREREALRLMEKFQTQQEIADAMGLSRQRVGQLIASLKKKGAVNGRKKTVDTEGAV